jgi:hypothetical protein
MFSTSDRNYLYITVLYAVLTISYLICEYIITGHHWGVPLDDTWIHFRFAENFANGHFFEFNTGEPVPGTTSPFWVIALSIPFLISSKLIIPYSYLIGSVFFLLIGFETYRLSNKLGFEKKYSLFAAALTLLAGRLAWSSLSGMEITLFCYLTIVIVKTHLNEIEQNKVKIITGLLIGLAAVTRPEAYLLALIYYILTIILFKNALKQNLKHLLLSLSVFAVIILPYPYFSYSVTGSFLPSTFEGQNAGLRFIPHLVFIIETGKLFFKENLIILILWLISSVYFAVKLIRGKADKKFMLIFLWVILLPLISSFVTPNWRHHGRYLIPLIPFINIVAIDILRKLIAVLEGKGTKLYRSAGKVIPFAVVFFSLNYTIIFALTLGWNTDNINDQQVKIANWINTYLPDETVLGMNDIGAITYITKKKTIDMAGLVTPEILKFRKISEKDGTESLLKLLKVYSVNYIIIYPDWYNYLMKNFSGSLEQVYSARLEKNTICGGIEMFVYKINWEKIKLN